MILYTVKNKPTAVRQFKSATAPIVNIAPVNGTLYVDKIEEGWLKLHNGFYVFATDNIVINTLDKETVEKIQTRYTSATNDLKVGFGSQRFADPIIINNIPGYYGPATTEVPTGHDVILTSQEQAQEYLKEQETKKSTLDQTKNTTDEPNKDTEESLKVINEKYANHKCILDKGEYVFATDGDGHVKLDKDGKEIRWTYEEFIKEYPDSTLFDAKSDCTIESIDTDGIAKVVDNSTGLVFYVDATHLSVNMAPNAANSGNKDTPEWERVQLTQEIYNARTSQEFERDVLNAVTKSIESVVDTIIDVNLVNTRMITRVHAYPYQFLPWVDNRRDNEDGSINMDMNKLGRKFTERIVARAPIFTIRAGVPQFMKGYDGVDKASVLANLTGLAAGAASKVAGLIPGINNTQLKNLSDILESDGKYYSFMPAAHSYFTAINTPLRMLAVLLNIGDVELPAFQSVSSEDEMKSVNNATMYQKLADMNWEYMVEHPFSGAYQGAVYFYINSDAQISESFSNSTRQSEIAGKVNNISDRAAEIQFIAGGVLGAVGASSLTSGTGASFESMLHSIQNAGLEGNNALGLGNSSGAGIFNSLLKNLSTMVSGSKMIFPEIWADSSFGRTYNITIKLVSPDCDKLSIYLNIFVPLIHLLGFVLPRSTGSNAYASPFLVQCWYKSMFHIDMGMVISCDIVKGETGAWTDDGLPTQVTVQLQIKDLYQVLSQASGQGGANHILANPAQMDYIANLCGVNIGATDIIRTVTLWKTLLFNGVQDDLISIPTKTLRSVSNAFFNLAP